MEEVVTNFTEKNYRVEVEKNTKGYNFSVKVAGDDMVKIMADTELLVNWCKDKYGA